MYGVINLLRENWVWLSAHVTILLTKNYWRIALRKSHTKQFKECLETGDWKGDATVRFRRTSGNCRRRKCGLVIKGGNYSIELVLAIAPAEGRPRIGLRSGAVEGRRHLAWSRAAEDPVSVQTPSNNGPGLRQAVQARGERKLWQAHGSPRWVS